MYTLPIIFGLLFLQLTVADDNKTSANKNIFRDIEDLVNGCSSRNTWQCTNDPFLKSEPYNGKVFLTPWDQKDRKGDWYHNVGYCEKHCAEMVTIQSAEENTFFHEWFRKVGIKSPGVWLGAQFFKAEKAFNWRNGESRQFSDLASGEPNGYGITSCLMVGWVDGQNKFWDHYCDTELKIACQRCVDGSKCNRKHCETKQTTF